MAAGHASLLGAFLCGVEKESLRVNTEGSIAHTAHPRALGSALTHPYITTDFSEALLELITPPLATMEEVLGFLRELHRFVYAHIGDEYLWATSMPCVVPGEDGVPIARYGTSNAGRMKHVYRVGLAHRYGSIMQAISGVHFNFSLDDRFWDALQALEGDTRPRQDFISDGYFGLIRNLQRVGWLVPYLFGASPAVCKSFLQDGSPGSLVAFDAGTWYSPYATSLRMGDIGYQNNREHEIGVRACYDNLDEYVDTLTYAINTTYPGYERIGVKVDGEYRQLNTNILQIENEYYTTVRPKQILQNGEKPTLALKRRGVRYIELRSLDVNVYEPLGIGEEQMRFLHLLMLWCLFEDSPRISPWERSEIDKNEMEAAQRGREPGLMLMRNGEQITLKQWAHHLCDALEPIACALDAGLSEGRYASALAMQRAAVEDPDRTPSARMLHEMRENGESFHTFAKRMSLQHRAWFRHLTPDAEFERRLRELGEKSLAEQREKEESDTLSFDDYLANYFAQSL